MFVWTFVVYAAESTIYKYINPIYIPSWSDRLGREKEWKIGGMEARWKVPEFTSQVGEYNTTSQNHSFTAIPTSQSFKICTQSNSRCIHRNISTSVCLARIDTPSGFTPSTRNKTGRLWVCRSNTKLVYFAGGGVLKIKGHTCIAVTHNLKGLQLVSGHFLFRGNLKSLLC